MTVRAAVYLSTQYSFSLLFFPSLTQTWWKKLSSFFTFSFLLYWLENKCFCVNDVVESTTVFRIIEMGSTWIMHWCCHQYKNLMKTNVGWEIVALYIPSEETPICTHFSTNLFIGQATVMYYRPLISVSVLRTARVVQAHIETMILLVGAYEPL